MLEPPAQSLASPVSSSQPCEPGLLSVVIPCYNEAAVLPLLEQRLRATLDDLEMDWEVVFVDDGSSDGSYQQLVALNAADPRLKVVRFSRNFGHQAAIAAGLGRVRGEVVAVLDADLQDPPELVAQMVEKWREGYDVVLARRATRSGESLAKRTTARLFYRVLGRMSQVHIPENVGDFRLMDRRVVEVLSALPERSRFMKGVFAWLGFRQVVLEYAREGRTAGDAKQNWPRLFVLAIDGIVSFTAAPLKIWSYLGFLVAAIAGIYGVWIILRTMIYGTDVPGYASLFVAVLFMNGLVLLSLGVLGEYMARIFTEVKCRPVYVIAAHDGVAALAGHRYATGRISGRVGGARLAPQRPELEQGEGGGRDGGDDDGQRQLVGRGED